MSDTPRTDAAIKRQCGYSVSTDFARELERENTLLQAVARAADAYWHGGSSAELVKALDELKAKGWVP